MKQTIENYGRIIVLLAAAFGAVFLIRNTVYSQLKANGVIQDTNHISSNEFFQKQGRPKVVWSPRGRRYGKKTCH